MRRLVFLIALLPIAVSASAQEPNRVAAVFAKPDLLKQSMAEIARMDEAELDDVREVLARCFPLEWYSGEAVYRCNYAKQRYLIRYADKRKSGMVLDALAEVFTAYLRTKGAPRSPDIKEGEDAKLVDTQLTSALAWRGEVLKAVRNAYVRAGAKQRTLSIPGNDLPGQ